jgi:hypothetical protein
MALGISGLTQDQIDNVLGSVKTRGEYDRQLKAMIESGEPGVMVSLTEGHFSDRKANSVKTGFESAKVRAAKLDEDWAKAAQDVRVLVHDESVYLIRTDIQSAAA